jgi:hypothetical protein
MSTSVNTGMDPPNGSIRREPVPEVGLTVLFEPKQPSLEYDLLWLSAMAATDDVLLCTVSCLFMGSPAAPTRPGHISEVMLTAPPATRATSLQAKFGSFIRSSRAAMRLRRRQRCFGHETCSPKRYPTLGS